MKYSKFDIEKIEESSDIRDHVPDLMGTGSTRYCKCPQCGKSGKNKGLQVTHKKSGGRITNIAKCFACGYTVTGSINAVKEFQNKSFIEAVEYLADYYNISITDTKKPKQKLSSAAQSIKGSFCERQLFSSGLTIDDVMVKVPVKGTDDFTMEPAFRKGGSDNIVLNLNDSDDEMLIHYYDLEGNHMMFQPKGRTSLKPRPYVRVRWSNPFAHSYEEGKEVKYQTPKGAPCAFYIPQYIRDRYQSSAEIETLIIQEGEKKAEKACKHDIPSLGIQGIYNIGNTESGLLKELQYIVQRCKVRNVVLMMDADWDNLSKNLKPGDSIDSRPNQFSKAVIKFQNYVKTLHKMNCPVDIFFGHINKNEKGAKGIDDLLVSELHLHESKLKEDIASAMLSHDGLGEYVSIHKITTKTEIQIRDFWHLNSYKEFLDKHRDVINELIYFRFSGINYAVEDGLIKEVKRNSNEKFWKAHINDKDKKVVEFKHKAALDFLEDNKFHKIRTAELRAGEFKIVKVDDNIVSESSGAQVRDFVYNYVLKSTKDEDVLNMFISRLENFLSPGKLERLTEIKDDFSQPEPWGQWYYYKDKSIHITDKGIDEDKINQFVWEDSIINRNFKRVPIIEFIKKYDDGGFDLKITEEGNKCEFLQFISCTSNFWKGHEDSMTFEERDMAMLHVINKITAIGYLLNSWKPRSEAICIIAMDAKMDEVGQSNGRSGKSMIGQALEKILNVTTVDMKNMKNDDEFVYSLVTPKTRLMFLDDTRVNFDFEKFYSALTGNMQINPKQGSRYEIKFDKAPKFLITTNHAINDQSSSGKDRRVMMAFSNYFTTDYNPSQHFGHMLFDDWDEEQWNLFDNFMMECVMYYLMSMSNGWAAKGRGVIPPPMHQLERRALRQIMGEAFLQWAEAYFDPSNSILNSKVSRKHLTEKYHEEFQSARESIRPGDFRKRMIAFCKYKGYHFNPNSKNEAGVIYSDWVRHNPSETFVGESYKSNSIEYWMIATPEYANSQPW